MSNIGRIPDPRERGFQRRHDVDEVLAILDQRIAPLGAEEISSQEAAGRVLAAAVTSPVDVPGFDRSAMDGFALRGEETFGAGEYSPVRFRVVGTSMPGRPYEGADLGPEEAVRIATGAPIPGGADSVLMVEATSTESDPATGTDRMLARDSVTPGKHVSRRGEDIRAGQEMLAAGRRLRPQDVGVLAATGVSRVSVVRVPSVEILVTGNELLPAGSVPEGTRIVDSNSPMLTALVHRDGGRPRTPTIVPDIPERLREAIEGSDADVLLLSGGSSVGPEDHVPRILAELGELPVHGVAMRPSSPAGIGFLGERPVFLLPGNPVSCLCAYDFFGGRAIRALGGHSKEWPYVTAEARLSRKLASQTGRVDYARVRLVDGAAEPLMVSGASMLSSTTRADGFVIVPRDDEGIPEGETVTVYLYG